MTTDTRKDPKLLPCPFCGSGTSYESGGYDSVWFSCFLCHARGPKVAVSPSIPGRDMTSARKLALGLWNTRTGGSDE